MKFIDCRVSPDLFPNGCEVVNGDTLIISMSVIGDYDGRSNTPSGGYSMQTGENEGPDFGVVAVQLLDSPYSTGWRWLWGSHDSGPDSSCSGRVE